MTESLNGYIRQLRKRMRSEKRTKYRLIQSEKALASRRGF